MYSYTLHEVYTQTFKQPFIIKHNKIQYIVQISSYLINHSKLSEQQEIPFNCSHRYAKYLIVGLSFKQVLTEEYLYYGLGNETADLILNISAILK